MAARSVTLTFADLCNLGCVFLVLLGNTTFTK